VLPGVRINLSKNGASASIGPRGANVSIGSHGVTANAGILGSGLSYRTRIAKPHSAVIGIVVLAIGLGFAAYKNIDRIAAWLAEQKAVQQPVAQPSTVAVPAQQAVTASKPNSIRAQAEKLLVPGGTIYVRRGGSVLRQTEKTSGATLKKLNKGAAVTVVALDGNCTQVKSGGVTGWMRTSVLGPKP